MNISSNNNEENNGINKFVLQHNNLVIVVSYAIGYILQFITCIVGNCLELYILPQIKPPSDYITYALCTLACNDLLIALFTMPVNLLRAIYTDWFLGELLCKLLLYFNFVLFLTGIWITVYISFDRYINICHPTRYIPLKTKTFCLIVLNCICFGNLLILSYAFLTLEVKYIKLCHCFQCHFDLPFLEFLFHRIFVNILYQFLVPVMLLIFFIYFILNELLTVHTYKSFLTSFANDELGGTSNNLLIVKVSQFFVIFFTFSNFPLFISRIYFFFYGETALEYKILIDIGHFMRTINSSLNPWIYSVYSIKYRNELYKIFHCNKQQDLTSAYNITEHFITPEDMFQTLTEDE